MQTAPIPCPSDAVRRGGGRSGFYATSYKQSVIWPPMASRKEQKEQARAARLAQEQATAAKAQRNRRLQIFGGAIAIAVIVIVVAIVISTSGGGGNTPNTSNGLAKGAQERQIVNSVDSLIGGIPQNGVTLGNPKAKVTMLYF